MWINKCQLLENNKVRASASHEGEEAGLSIPQDHQSANDILSCVVLFCMQHVGQFSVIR